MLSRTTKSGKSLRSLLFPRYSSSSTAAGHEECDIAIVGGGPAGLALASALVSKQIIRDSVKITLVEAGDLSKVRQWNPAAGTYSNRVSSLTNASQAFLYDVGAWAHVDAERTMPIEAMQVWDGVSDARIGFSATELGLDNGMARLTENLNLQRGLLKHLDQASAVQILDKTKVQSIAPGQDHWPLVHLDNGRTLRARLLIGADGFNSPVRTYAKIPSFGWSYDTQGIVATMSHPPRGAFESPNTTAYQRFLPTGPIAFLPLSPTVSSLVWSTKPHIAAALQAADPAILAYMINAAFRLPEVSMRYLYDRILESKSITVEEIRDEILWRERSHSIDQHSAFASAAADTSGVGIPPTDSEMVPPLVTAIQTGTIASFPLRFNHADAYLGEGEYGRTVLVGDAAHTVHPLAGQGLNLGLADVECLARCIHNAVQNGGDIGSYTALMPYAHERYFENHKLMSVMDKLHKLYSTTSEPIVWARSMGLEVLNELDTLKAAIMLSAGAASPTNTNHSAFTTLLNLGTSGMQTASALSSAMNVVRGAATTALSRGISGLLKR
ncbi:ubiquinone biosynthesis hydrox [Mycena floridula]|nr:ubiquinone biosynthesis hydrox [Mycena floridula]